MGQRFPPMRTDAPVAEKPRKPVRVAHGQYAYGLSVGREITRAVAHGYIGGHVLDLGDHGFQRERRFQADVGQGGGGSETVQGEAGPAQAQVRIGVGQQSGRVGEVNPLQFDAAAFEVLGDFKEERQLSFGLRRGRIVGAGQV